ncbi:MAG TPA: cation transporter, partial [Chthoniobacterales bacterium]|nr:cation transporter [Chthoniobacterales bacterium]
MNSAEQTEAAEKNLQTHQATTLSVWETGARVALLGLVINTVLASAKIAAGILGNAYVLIADGIESALDIGGSLVIWGGLKLAARPPDATHPYG